MENNYGDRPAIVAITKKECQWNVISVFQPLTGEVSFIIEEPQSGASDEKDAWKTQSATSLRRTAVFHGKKSGM
jgi:hypothetical protein